MSSRKLFAGLCCCGLLVSLTIVCLRPARSPPSVAISHLGYTNGTGPYALLAITNCSDSAIALDSTCLVKYSPTQGAQLRRVTSYEANKLRVTRLLPNEGFVQEVFVFPAGQGEWQFECYAAYSSGWPVVRRAAQNRVRKLLGRARLPFPSKGSYKFDTEWFSCPS